MINDTVGRFVDDGALLSSVYQHVSVRGVERLTAAALYTVDSPSLRHPYLTTPLILFVLGSCSFVFW
ncbi:MAG: hypothetical protein ACYCYO_12665 [Bacilli bacterium]